MADENKIYVTEDGLKKLQDEYYHLVHVVREEVKSELKEARSLGDLSENADYDAARDKQSQVESRIVELESMLQHYVLIDTKQGSKKIVRIGSTVTLEFLDTKGREMIHEVTSSRIHDLGERTPLHVLRQAGYSEEFVRDKLVSAYRESVVNAVNSALKRINVASIVENKINSMSVEELEKGVLQVMKTELDMIVRLGALIGLVIGSINIFI